MSITDLFKKRRQIRAAWDQEKIPSKELIHSLLEQTLDIAASKQNLFPFKIHVIEPDNIADHEKIAGICSLFKTGSVNDWEKERPGEKTQTYTKAPYVLVYTLRLCKPNVFVTAHSERHQEWDRFNQVLPNKYRKPNNMGLAAVEVGMFQKALTGLCLENDLQVSYIHSFPWWRIRAPHYTYEVDENKVGYNWRELPYIDEAVLLVAQIGHKAEIDDPLESHRNPGDQYEEDKPSIDTIVEYHK